MKRWIAIVSTFMIVTVVLIIIAMIQMDKNLEKSDAYQAAAGYLSSEEINRRYGPGWSEYTNYPVGYGAIVVAHILASLEPTMRPASLQINWSYLTENKEIKAPDYLNSGDPLAKRQ